MPLAVLQTCRLRLRPLTLADIPEIFRHASDPMVTRYMAWERHSSSEMSEDFVRNYAFPNYEKGIPDPFAITLVSRPTLLMGIVGCNMVSESAMELGYWLGVPFWGNGYAREAAWAVLDSSFAKFPVINRVEARHFRENLASGRILENLGMQREGIAREARLKDGRLWDIVTCSILRREWESRKSLS